MKPPLVSFICPSHNRAGLLGICAAKILGQRIFRAQCIIVDDASNDDTESECRELVRRHGDAVVIMKNPDNQGACHSRNRGLERATGDYVVFADSDDVIIPEGMDRLLRELEGRRELDFAYGTVIRTDDELAPIPGRLPLGSRFARVPSEAAGYHWHTMGAMYRRRSLSAVGPWNVELSGSQDWEFQARVKLAGLKGEFVDTPVGFFRQHQGPRLGRSRFQPEYCRSAILASRSISDWAKSRGCQDRALHARLAGKVWLVALQYGREGCRAERNQGIGIARAMLEAAPMARLGLQLMTWFPPVMDGFLYHLIRRIKCEQRVPAPPVAGRSMAAPSES